jgi:hypothetical protein
MTSMLPFAAVDATPLTTKPAENLRLTMRIDSWTTVELVVTALVRSISNQNSRLRLDAAK